MRAGRDADSVDGHQGAPQRPHRGELADQIQPSAEESPVGGQRSHAAGDPQVERDGVGQPQDRTLGVSAAAGYVQVRSTDLPPPPKALVEPPLAGRPTSLQPTVSPSAVSVGRRSLHGPFALPQLEDKPCSEHRISLPVKAGWFAKPDLTIVASEFSWPAMMIAVRRRAS